MITILKKTVIKEKIKIFGGGFNPLTYDAGNLLALYDGDTIQVDAPGWNDQSVNGYNLTLFNNPTRTPNAINGHDALLFDGISQYAANLNPAFLRTQPYTFYFVFNNLTWVNFQFILDGQPSDTGTIQNRTAVNNLSFGTDGVTFINTNPDPVLNYDIITVVANGANSEIRTNNNASFIGNAGIGNCFGVGLGARIVGINFVNIEVAYLIVRGVADNTATQNLFINFLKTRFAL
jgi:hypothetical protein